MLTVEPASRPARDRPRFGIALAGGGPLGLFYELGTLRALDESIHELDLGALDVYVGVSSGAFLSACLANGLTTSALGRILINTESERFPLKPEDFLRPALGEYARRLKRLPRLLAEMLGRIAQLRAGEGIAQALEPLWGAVPAGVFDNEAIERLLAKLFTTDGRTNDFRELAAQLYVVATDLNSGQAARFGTRGWDTVPISRAVQASTALPGVFPPVTIDGRVYVDGALRRTMHASLALDDGCDFVICINPLVPFDTALAGEARTRVQRDLSEGGLVRVLSQTFRAMIQSRMQVGMADYKESYPTADILLFEPDADDEEMFFANVFRYGDRHHVADHAYQRARRDLLANADSLKPLLARHGLTLDTDVLADPARCFEGEPAPHHTGRSVPHALKQLDEALDRLENTLGQRE